MCRQIAGLQKEEEEAEAEEEVGGSRREEEVVEAGSLLHLNPHRNNCPVVGLEWLTCNIKDAWVSIPRVTDEIPPLVNPNDILEECGEWWLMKPDVIEHYPPRPNSPVPWEHVECVD